MMSAYLPYRTKVFIGINVRDIRNCQNREIFKPTKIISQQVLVAQTGIQTQDLLITNPSLY